MADHFDLMDKIESLSTEVLAGVMDNATVQEHPELRAEWAGGADNGDLDGGGNATGRECRPLRLESPIGVLDPTITRGGRHYRSRI